jgi:hypothetical protein
MSKTSNLYLYLCTSLVFGGCLADPGAETDPPAADEPATETATQDLAQPSSHHQTVGFGGSLFSQAFSYVTEEFVVGGNCTTGYKRPAAPDVQWTSQAGGFCAFAGWNTGDIHDCRARIQGSTGGGFFGGDCQTWVREVQESGGTTTPAGSYSYTAVATGSAQGSTVNYSIPLTAGRTLTIGTCGVVGASFSGDTYLRLFDQGLTQVAANDDACSGLGSQITFTAPSSQTYEIHAGCYSSNSCAGTVSWTIQ